MLHGTESIEANIGQGGLHVLCSSATSNPLPDFFTRTAMEKFRKQKRKYPQYLIIKAIADGVLIKPKRCSLCKRGGLKINAHHNDYDKLLEVEWLCNKCHIRKHRGIAWDDDSHNTKKPSKRTIRVSNGTNSHVRIRDKYYLLPVLKDDPCQLVGLFLESNLIDHRQDYETVDTAKLQKLIKELSRREREIIKLHYGFGGGDTCTLEEIGRIFKVTSERVRQVEAKAIRRLRKRAKSYDEFI